MTAGYVSAISGEGAGEDGAVENIKGRALIIYWSWDGPDRWVRWERIGRLVY